MSSFLSSHVLLEGSFTESESKGKRYFGAKIIPARGVWIEVESDPDGGIYVRIDKKRKFSVASLLRVLGLATDEAIMKAFPKASEEVIKALKICLEKDPAKTLIRLIHRDLQASS